MNQRLKIIGAALALLAAAACGGHGAPGNGVTPHIPAYTGPASLSNFDWGKSQLDGAAFVGPANAGFMQVHVLVKQQNAFGLIQYAKMASDPTSPVYRHFLTPQQIGAMYGASQKDYQAAADYFVSQGLSVAGWPQHLILSVSGSQANMERAFGTTFGTYTKNGMQFIAPIGTPHFQKMLPVDAVANLVSYNTMHRHFIVPPRANGNDGPGYSPQQVRNAFDYSGAYQAGYNGSGITVGIIGTGPIDINRSNPVNNTFCGADADVNALKALFSVSNVASICEEWVTTSAVSAGLSASGISPAPSASPSPGGYPTQPPTLNQFPYSGNFASPPPVTAPNPSCNAISGFTTPRDPSCNPEDTEAQLDTQQVATLAPGANVTFYLAYNTNDCVVYYPNSCVAAPSPLPSPTPPNYGYPAEGLVEADPEIQQAIADNTADVVSLSYGGGETDNIGYAFSSNGIGWNPEEFAALAAEGTAVFVSSGDGGATECSTAGAKCVSYPAGDPSVTSVGGVNAPLNEFGQLTGNLTAWGNTNGGNGGSQAQNWSGSGGGVSTVFNAPPWQASALGITMREQPDVSLLADPFTGVTVYSNASFGGGYGAIGGTSVAAPEMAAMWALVLEACKSTPACTAQGSGSHPYRLGNASPYFYAIYKNANQGGTGHTGFAPQLPYANVFYDVVYGENGMFQGGTSYTMGYPATTGYDEVTGLGVPYAGHLIQAVTGASAP